jgi:hypothetical protein
MSKPTKHIVVPIDHDGQHIDVHLHLTLVVVDRTRRAPAPYTPKARRGRGRPRTDWRPFTDARKAVRALGLSTRAQFEEWARSSSRPWDIPSNPQRSYRDEWTSWPDFLGV